MPTMSNPGGGAHHGAPAPAGPAPAAPPPPPPPPPDPPGAPDDPAAALMAPFALPFAPEPEPEQQQQQQQQDVAARAAAVSAAAAAVSAAEREAAAQAQAEAQAQAHAGDPNFPPPASHVDYAAGDSTGGGGGGAGAEAKGERTEETEEAREDKPQDAAAENPSKPSSATASAAKPKKRRGRPPGSKNRTPRKPPGSGPRFPKDEEGFTPVHRDPSPPPAPEHWKTKAAREAKAKAAAEGAEGGAEGADGGEASKPKGPPKRTKHKQLVTSEGRCRRCLEGPKFKKGHARTCPKSVHYGAPIPPDSSSSESEWETDTDAEGEEGEAEEWEDEAGGEARPGAGEDEAAAKAEDGDGGAEGGAEAESPASSPRRTTPRRAASAAAVQRHFDEEIERRLKAKQRQRQKEGGGGDDDDNGREEDDIMREIETLARPSGVEGLEEALGERKRKRGRSLPTQGAKDGGEEGEGEGAPPKKMRRKKKKKRRRRKRKSGGDGEDDDGEEEGQKLLSPLEEYKLAEKQREEAIEAAEVAKREMEEAIAKYEAAKQRITHLTDLIKSKADSVIDARLGDESEWSRMYARLQGYKDVHGNILFPLSCYKSDDADPDLRALFEWVMKQRKTARHMAAWRKKALDRIGFVYDTHDATWEARFLELSRYRDRTGTCIVPHNFPENPQLGQWVSTQRRMRRNLADGKAPKNCVLTDERVARLDSIGFVWDAPTTAWSERFKELLSYKAETGSFNVPNPYPPNPPLQRWVQTQRTHYRYYREGNPKCQLTAERIRMLEDVGFSWRQRPDWRSTYERLVRYKAEYGTCVVSEGYDKSLAKWTRNQRTEYRLMLEGRKNKLKPDHVRMLDEIGFDWIPPTKR